MMVVLADKAPDLEQARRTLAGSLDDGSAWQKFVEWIASQGGDRSVLESPHLLPAASLIEDLPSPHAGYIAGLDPLEVGMTCVLLGGGREKKTDSIDYAVGIVHHKKVGDWAAAGERLLTIHANDPDKLAAAHARLLNAFRWSDEPVEIPPHTHKIIL
jgi:pyrimidine-nucleoside phosphorylase